MVFFTRPAGDPSMSNKTKIEKTGEYIGKTPEGKSYSIFEYTEFLDITTQSDTEDKWHPGKLMYKLPNGDPVNHVEGNTYQLVRTKEKVTLTRA